LVGDHLRAITPHETGEETLREWLGQAGVNGFKVEAVEPTLEDVFLALAMEGKG
jgi:hypothetical protein